MNVEQRQRIDRGAARMSERIVFEASELGWPPGSFAQSFSLRAETFVYVATDRTPDGEVAGWRYASNQREVLVIND